MHIRPMLPVSALFLALSLTGGIGEEPLGPLSATEPAERQEVSGASIRVEPSSLDLDLGEEARLDATLRDEEGDPIEAELLFFSSSRQSLGVASGGRVTAHRPGEFRVIVVAPGPGGGGEEGPRTEVPVTVQPSPAARIEITGLPDRNYVGAVVEPGVRVLAENGDERDDLEPELASSDVSVFRTDGFGRLVATGEGEAALTARVEGISAERPVRVVPDPVRSVELTAEREEARTGDVVRFRASARDEAGEAVEDAPVTFSVSAQPVDTLIAPPSSAQISGEGRFVAEKPGLYTVTASSGGVAARRAIRVEERDVERELERVGHGPVRHVHTSDLWVWEGVDGRDYAITGTWGGDGLAYFWDVTDPSDMVRVDSVRVDARTVNDVKISEDGRIGVISREGASNRRNGLVILDVSDPTNVAILAEYDEELTGGVHNVFIHRDHVYAVNNGRRYDIIDIEDPENPHRVARFELDTPGHALHDVWVDDGIAYSSNWGDGVVIVDVGGGPAGGSPSNPVQLGSYSYPSGANHAAFPYHGDDGRFYVIAGDEIFPEGLGDLESPVPTAGYIHFIDFTDLDDPKEVARYQVPEEGTHNFWVDGDLLYVAYYTGGFRVVDISGELQGDLYRQGREVATFLPHDAEGYIPNAPMTWGPMPHKGNIFLSDWNSGLWAVRLAEEGGETAE